MKFLVSSKGQVLTSTIITALVVLLIAAGLMRLVFMRYTAANKVTVELKSARCVQLAVAQFFSTWDRLSSSAGVTDPLCSSASPLFSCSGTPGQCSCTCTFTSGSLNGLTVSVSAGPNGANPPCTFTAQTTTASIAPFAPAPPACQ